VSPRIPTARTRLCYKYRYCSTSLKHSSAASYHVSEHTNLKLDSDFDQHSLFTSNSAGSGLDNTRIVVITSHNAMDECRITPILKLPGELLLMILARVPFQKHRNYHNLRLVSRHWDDIFRQNVKNLPKQIAQQQYLHLHQIRNVMVPASSPGWPALLHLAYKSQRLQAWIELLLPHGDHHVVTLGVILIDAICSMRPVYRCRGRLQEDSNSTVAMLACSRLVRLVLPPQALLLIRYIVLLTDSALLTRHRLFPTAQLSYLRMSEAELEANRLCRFLVFEAKL